jgi:GNAT superfamily N-acetyltransferase
MSDTSIRIADLGEENVDDALNICTPPNVREDRDIQIGCQIRKKWLMDLYRSIGPCAKIAYVKDNPVGIIQYTPLHIIPYFKTNRRDALYIHCIYVQERYRKRGIGSALLEALISEVSKPNKFFGQVPCSMLIISANRVHGYSKVGLFKHKVFRRIKGNADVGLVLPLSSSVTDTKLDIPGSKPKTLKERGVKIFFKPTCQYCKRTNERVIKAEIRKVNRGLPIEECDLWTCSEEAIRRRITYVTTYVNGKPLPPMSPRKFLEALRRLASEPSG